MYFSSVVSRHRRYRILPAFQPGFKIRCVRLARFLRDGQGTRTAILSTGPYNPPNKGGPRLLPGLRPQLVLSTGSYPEGIPEQRAQPRQEPRATLVGRTSCEQNQFGGVAFRLVS